LSTPSVITVKKLDGHQKNYSTIEKVWREPANHVTDCYFCAVDVTGINRKNRSNLKYPDLESARRPDLVYCTDIVQLLNKLG